jgi:predicted nucleic acid-binding protein
MKYLLDTGILLRLVHPTDPRHREIVNTLATLKSRGNSFYAAIQNIAEFWNVSTRPVGSRGGFGLLPDEVERRLSVIERAVEILSESIDSYAEWKRLVKLHKISGVQVHDARLVAVMNVQGIQNIVTLNADDFKRYQNVAITTPTESIRS